MTMASDYLQVLPKGAGGGAGGGGGIGITFDGDDGHLHGWRCPQCMNWIPFGHSHGCSGSQVGTFVTQKPPLERIADALERIALSLQPPPKESLKQEIIHEILTAIEAAMKAKL